MELKKECLGKVAITIEKDYHNPNKAYDKLVIVEQEGAYKTYISRKAVPTDTPLTDREYWIPFSSLAEELQLDYNRYKSKLEIELTELKENFNSFSNANKEIEQLYNLFCSHGFIGGAKDKKLLANSYTDHIDIVYTQLSTSEWGAGGKTIAITLPSATTEKAGVMSSEDKSKLDSIEVEKLYTSDNLDLSNYVPKTEFDIVKTELDTLKAEFAKFKEDTTTLLNDLYNIVKTN